MGGWVNRRILIVDDNKDIHKDFRKILDSFTKRQTRKHLDELESALFADEEEGAEEISAPPPGVYDVEYEIDSAYQGREALDMIEKAYGEDRPYALVFMDVRMPPGMDGIETISHIWRKFPNVEIVICTAYSDYSFEEILEKLGTSDRLLFLNKPFDSIVVKQMALSLTRKWTLHDEARRHVLRLKEEIMQRRESEARLNHLIHHDSLTSLGNRNLLQIHLEECILQAKRHNTRFALFFIDLDRFKEVNDTLGYQNGDLLIHQIAMRLQDTFVAVGRVYRQGGDEFAILVSQITSQQHTHMVALQIQKTFEPHFDLDGLNIELHPSIGIVIFPDHGCSMDMLMRHADMTLAYAKKAEQGFRLYRDTMNLYTPQRLLLLSELRHAISSDDLMLYFQPRIDLRNRKIVGVEALTRWPHAIHGFIPPGEFIPLAERCGVIKHLTSWVLKEVSRQWANWKERGLDLFISVNLTGQDLMDHTLPIKIQESLAIHGMPCRRLRLEFSEMSVMDDPAMTKNLLKVIADMGVTISIDNFGTGYSSLAYLKMMPVSEIKIDQSFVKDLSSASSNDVKIVHSMISLGHNLGLSVVAEGVSSSAVMETLRTFGCDYLQGTIINHPVPGGELILWLDDSDWEVTNLEVMEKAGSLS